MNYIDRILNNVKKMMFGKEKSAEQIERIKESERILTNIKEMLLSIGFVENVVSNDYRDEINYVLGTTYCIPKYIETLGFLIEYADSYEEAKRHFHGDGDIFPLEMGEEAILEALEREIRENCIRSQ